MDECGCIVACCDGMVCDKTRPETFYFFLNQLIFYTSWSSRFVVLVEISELIILSKYLYQLPREMVPLSVHCIITTLFTQRLNSNNGGILFSFMVKVICG